MHPEQKKVIIRKRVNAPLKLTTLQASYFNLMKQETMSLAEILEFCHKAGEPIVFHELWQLLLKLDQTNLLEQPRLSDWQGTQFDSKISLIAQKHNVTDGKSEKISASELKQLPFFRNLKDEILNLFASHSSIYNLKSGTFLCKQGDQDRSLFVILEGQASIYQTHTELNQRTLLSRCERGSVMGEVGFFLGENRTADIIMTQNGKIIKIEFIESLNEIIKKDVVPALRERLYFMQAILKSSFFRNLKDYAIDALLMLGEKVTLAENEILFREGDIGDSFYLIVQGNLVVTQRSQTINVLNAGSSLGEIAFLLKAQTRTATVKAQSPTLLMKITYSRLLQLIFNNIPLGYMIEQQGLERLQRDQNRRAG